MAAAKKSRIKGRLTVPELRDMWSLLSPTDRLAGFRALDRLGAEEFFLNLNPYDKAHLLIQFPEMERRTWARFLPPDDVAHLVQTLSSSEREDLLNLIDEPTRKEVLAVLAYEEDEAGGLMNPQFIRLRPDISVDGAISYLRRQTQQKPSGTLYYAYVLAPDQRLLGVISFRQLLASPPEKRVEEVMRRDPVTISDKSDREAVARLFQDHKLMAIPVVDEQNYMKGVVTLDDVIQLVQQQATQEIQKIGGTEALDEPYMRISFFRMVKKRAGWLTILFLSEMLTATAMGYFEGEISKAVVLALFIPLIISSGGNSGSQACTLVIRAMALGEVRLRDWWRVFFREIMAGLSLGIILGTIGLCRILLWPNRHILYGEHFILVGLTVASSLVGIVLWGSLTGSLLPFALRRLGFDPASASAPFVATLVDVTGLIIYFTAASVILRGTLL